MLTYMYRQTPPTHTHIHKLHVFINHCVAVETDSYLKNMTSGWDDEIRTGENLTYYENDCCFWAPLTDLIYRRVG